MDHAHPESPRRSSPDRHTEALVEPPQAENMESSTEQQYPPRDTTHRGDDTTPSEPAQTSGEHFMQHREGIIDDIPSSPIGGTDKLAQIPEWSRPSLALSIRSADEVSSESSRSSMDEPGFLSARTADDNVSAVSFRVNDDDVDESPVEVFVDAPVEAPGENPIPGSAVTEDDAASDTEEMEDDAASRASIHEPAAAAEDLPPPDKGTFNELPDEIIQQILHLTDPNGFASLAVLNRKWRDVAQRPQLYHHHLSLCPTYATSNAKLPPADEENLPLLRQLFAREAKRSLFEAYLRPREAVFKLVSTAISSSSCPGGEGMHFSFSPCGHHVLAYNSSRIYVIDVRGEDIDIKREFKILRRPASVCIKDDASLLAVLSSEMQVDLYDLESSPPRRKHSVILDNAPRTIALSPCGSVLAAAYEGGIEVSSLNPGALVTDRRAVKCDGVDALAFSFDGTQILGTSLHSFPANTVILTAPYYDPESQAMENNVSAMWTTSILFPNTSRDCSHAVLLQDGSDEEASWTFTYDRSFETFRAVRIDDLRNGTTYFTGPTQKAATQPKLLPSTAPSANYRGEIVTAGFQGKDVWVYGIPASLEPVPELANNGEGEIPSSNPSRTPSSNARHSLARVRETDGEGMPQWQHLCDQSRNRFVAGSKVTEVPGMGAVKWVSGFGTSPAQERLVVGAAGVVGPRLVTEEEDVDFVDGGRITLLDFDYAVSNGKRSEITIEVGSDNAEILEEEQRDLETEVAIVRRRTVAQKRSSRVALLRSATTGAASMPEVPPLTRDEVPTPVDDDPLVPRRVGQAPAANRNTIVGPVDSDTASIEEQEALDLPYSHASPRSGTTLRRAATAAAVNRQLNPRTADGRRIEYRRADGRPEHPHESDADNWVPPPPPYQKEDPGDLPAFLRGAAVPPVPAIPALPTSPFSNVGGSSRQPIESQWRPSSIDSMRRPTSSQWRPSHHRTASDSTTMSRRRTLEAARPLSTPSAHVDLDNLYDVSPPESPRPIEAVPQPQQPVADRPQEASVRTSPTEYSPPLTMPQSSMPAAQTEFTPPLVMTPSSLPSSHSEYASPLVVSPPSLTSGHSEFSPPLVASPPLLPSGHSEYTPPLVVSPQALSPGYSEYTPHLNMPVAPVHIGNTSVGSPVMTSPVERVEAPPAELSGRAMAPALGLQIPHQQAPILQPNMSAPVGNRRLSNSQTWPLAPQPIDHISHPPVGYPYSAPVARTATTGFSPELPPLPTSNQLASLSKRISQGNPKRLSGGFQISRVPVGSRDTSRTWSQYGDPATDPDVEQPLIISTPTGVQGAFDPPSRRPMSMRVETPILAPIPRHPRPMTGVSQRPTVERLETIYSNASNPVDDGSSQRLRPRSSHSRFIPSWFKANTPKPSGVSSASMPALAALPPIPPVPPIPSRHNTSPGPSIHRRPSRAERSAARNMQDSRRSGWTTTLGRPKSVKSVKSVKRAKSKARGRKKEADVASEAGWADVQSPQKAKKEKKCAVM